MIRRTALPPSWACWCSHPPAGRGAGQDRPRVRDRPRERGRQHHVRARLAGAVSRRHPHRAGRVRPELLRDRAQLAAELPRDGQRPVIDGRHAGRLRGVHRHAPGRAELQRPGRRPGMCLSRVGQHDRRPAGGQAHDLEGLHGGHGRRPGARRRHKLCASGDRRARHDPAGEPRRPVRDPPQPIRLLPLGHRPHDNCAARDVSLKPLQGDLASIKSTPNLSFITPDLCHDGHDATCADGGPGGLAAADAFLRTWVPRITASPAYQRDGLLAIVFDEASTSDSSACCGEQPGPNTPAPGGPSGGRRTGAVLLSPRIAPGTVTQQPYNHYSLLSSLEDAFGLAQLGYAGAPGPQSFGSDVFTSR